MKHAQELLDNKEGNEGNETTVEQSNDFELPKKKAKKIDNDAIVTTLEVSNRFSQLPAEEEIEINESMEEDTSRRSTQGNYPKPQPQTRPKIAPASPNISPIILKDKALIKFKLRNVNWSPIVSN